ncbi:hypothetical protein VCHA36P166_140120 [Vibrio chagasii]|nr:hypothetical protein VCHA36P166_140120 [Vibrio chagasii]
MIHNPRMGTKKAQYIGIGPLNESYGYDTYCYRFQASPQLETRILL